MNPVHRSVVEAEGLKIETEDPTGTLIEPVDPVTGERLPARPLIPDPGWAHNPAKARWQPDLGKYPEELRRQFGAQAVEELSVGGNKYLPAIHDERWEDIDIYKGKGIAPDSWRYHQLKGLVKAQLAGIRGVVAAEYRNVVKQIRIWDVRCPHDEYWAKHYGIPNFHAAATGGKGNIDFWEYAYMHVDDMREHLKGTISHEFAHNLAREKYGIYAPSGWADLTKKEGWVSAYSDAVREYGENFADTFKMFMANDPALDEFKGKKEFMKTLLEAR